MIQTNNWYFADKSVVKKRKKEKTINIYAVQALLTLHCFLPCALLLFSVVYIWISVMKVLYFSVQLFLYIFINKETFYKYDWLASV